MAKNFTVSGRHRPGGMGRFLGLAALFALIWGAYPLLGSPATNETHPEALDVSAALRPLDPEAWLGMGPLGSRRLQRLVERIDGANERCIRAGTSDRRGGAKAKMTRLFEVLSKSPTARELIDRAWRRQVFVCSDADTDLLAYYVSGLRLVGVNPRLTEAQQVVFLAHELAHIPQHPVYSDDRRFSASDLVLLRRSREAAAEALATCILWELREAGYSDGWEAKRRDEFYGDIAAAFSDARASGDDVLTAMRAAYDQWFAGKARRRLYDGMTVDHLTRIASDEIGLLSPARALDHAFLLGIGGSSRGNYLATWRGRPLTDVYYSGGLSFDHAAEVEILLKQSENRVRPLTGTREAPRTTAYRPLRHPGREISPGNSTL